jgi:hypothetical protein
MKLITRTHRYTIHSSGSQVAPIAADERCCSTVLSTNTNAGMEGFGPDLYYSIAPGNSCCGNRTGWRGATSGM